jgi:hypothetical protein
MGVFTVIGVLSTILFSLVGFAVVVGGFAKYFIGDKEAK